MIQCVREAGIDMPIGEIEVRYCSEFKRWMLAWVKSDKHLTMHCIRHTFATLQLAARTPLYVVSEMLDHSSIKMTGLRQDSRRSRSKCRRTHLH